MANIRVMRFRLPEFQESNLKTKKLRSRDLPNGLEEVIGVFQY